MSTKYDVRIITSKEGFNQMKAFIDKELEGKENKIIFDAFNELSVKMETPNFILIGWNNVKFEADFLKYKLIKRALEKLEDMNIGYSISKCDNSVEFDEYRFDAKGNNEVIMPIPEAHTLFDDEESMRMLEIAERELEETINEMESDP